MEQRLKKYREFLVDRIDPDFGLLDKLLANRTLMRETIHKIQLKVNTSEDKNRILLDFILNNKKATELVSALWDSEQIHLVNYLNADGVYENTYADDWPLGESEISQLEINRESLVELLDTSDLCLRLFSEKVINSRQRELICSKPTRSEKNEVLLDILIKCSLRQYKKMITCLNDSNQHHIAELLSKGGVVVRVHASLKVTTGNVDELEEEIISRLTKVLEDRPLEDAARLWELTQQRIIAARKGQSIVIYIHCMTQEELQQLIDLLMANRLTQMVERVFMELLSIGGALRISLTWSLEEFKRASKRFGLEFQSLNRLNIIGKDCEHNVTTETKYTQTDEDYFRDSESEVLDPKDELEQQLENKGNLTKLLVEHRKEIDEQFVSDHTRFICQNFHWLTESLDPDSSLLPILREREVLNNQECKYIESFTDRFKKNETLLCIMTRKTSDEYKKFQNAMVVTLQSDILTKRIFDESRYTPDPVLVQTMQTKASNEGRMISGLTILDKAVFVVSADCSEVEVYDSMKLIFSHRWTCFDLINPLDIGSCERSKCLYVVDFKDRLEQGNEILRIDPNGRLILKWSTGSDCGVLSVTDESIVILTVLLQNKLNEYSPDGHLIREINLSLDSGFCWPWHAIKLTSGHFVVSHGYGSDDLHRVCVVNGNGKLEKSFGGKRGMTTGQLNRPCYLAVDGNGFVMVSDYSNGRICLLDSNLEFKREIFSINDKHGLHYPWRILLDQSNDRLFVTEIDWNETRISIFQFK